MASGGLLDPAAMQAEALAAENATPDFWQQPSMVGQPTVSQNLQELGLALLAADQNGLASGLMTYTGLQQARLKQSRDARRSEFEELELLDKIQNSAMTRKQLLERNATIERLKKSNPELSDLIDLDPEAAAKVIAENAGPKKPYEGTGIDAQNANILLTGDPNTAEYAAAYNMLSAPKTERGADGSVSTISPNMSAYRKPTFTGAPAEVAAAAQQTVAEYGDKGGIAVGDPTSFGVEKAAAAGYAQRMQNADEILDVLPAGADQGKTGVPGYLDKYLLPDSWGEGVVKENATPEQQQFLNGANEWIRAKLRKESGAAIGKDEMRQEYETYFPVPGDTPEAIAQKRSLRLNATNSMKAASGGAYEGLYGGKKTATPAAEGDQQAGVTAMNDRGSSPQPTAAPANSSPAMPKTKAEYDALPPGSLYVKNGVTKRKK